MVHVGEAAVGGEAALTHRDRASSGDQTPHTRPVALPEDAQQLPAVGAYLPGRSPPRGQRVRGGEGDAGSSERGRVPHGGRRRRCSREVPCSPDQVRRERRPQDPNRHEFGERHGHDLADLVFVFKVLATATSAGVM